MEKTLKTYYVNLFIAGDIQTAREVMRHQCFIRGLCVTLEPCEYIYTGGLEAGMRVGFINYPRFPKNDSEIWEIAEQTAEILRARLSQWSYLLQSNEATKWISHREETPKAETGR